MRSLLPLVLLGGLVLAGCSSTSDDTRAQNTDTTGAAANPPAAAAALPACDADNGGITLPQGFCAVVVSASVSPKGTAARQVAVAQNGTVYIAVQGKRNAETTAERGGVVAVRDTNGDGKADTTAFFGPEGGSGIDIEGNDLYFATNTAVLHYKLGDGLTPVSGPDTLVEGLPGEHGHTAKSIALGPSDQLWVNIGSPTNDCQAIEHDREAGYKGLDPCPQLQDRAGVWLFSASKPHQHESDGQRWATGIRNAMGLAYNTADQTLYGTQHGRDQLNLWPGFTAEDNATRPAEELQRLTKGADFGWPYCYFDTKAQKRVLSPEYGGNGTEVGRCAQYQTPLVSFPGHWAPNDLIFYTGNQFPAHYQGGAFIAFHGSWNRAPLPQAGYKVVFVPWVNGQPSQNYETFADGFAGKTPEPGTAAHRPMGLAQGPDGSLYITDDSGNTVWRVMYRGQGAGAGGQSS
ncbi:MAG TPA: PQQ-dependent sugar dehydrogenase [Longimicrobiaceae bacterium]|nr:PQQ-dependent sugar dehydrogenase [Longimicrobiaceae bacterium]